MPAGFDRIDGITPGRAGEHRPAPAAAREPAANVRFFADSRCPSATTPRRCPGCVPSGSHRRRSGFPFVPGIQTEWVWCTPHGIPARRRWGAPGARAFCRWRDPQSEQEGLDRAISTPAAMHRCVALENLDDELAEDERWTGGKSPLKREIPIVLGDAARPDFIARMVESGSPAHCHKEENPVPRPRPARRKTKLLFSSRPKPSLALLSQRTLPVFRSRQSAAYRGLVSASVVETKTRSSQMAGVAALGPGNPTVHRAVSRVHVCGSPFSSVEPLKCGPRHWGQFSAGAEQPSVIAVTTRMDRANFIISAWF